VDFLRTIARERKDRLKQDARRVSLVELRDRAEARGGDARPFASSLRRATGEPIRLIAEVKRASPSAGVLRSEYDPAGIAIDYARAGAAAISVLTEPYRFLGSVEDLRRVREKVDVPVLLKDFVVDERQIYEGRAAGADAVLLIVALLSPTQLRDYATLAADVGLDALVEIHDEAEVERALEVEGVIGVNNRNLRTLAIRSGWAERLIDRLPVERVRVAESGYRTREEIANLERLGADAVLVGESLVREASPGGALARLLGREAREPDR
jgi:indole-3-glycerol phosphate synthase